MRGDFETPLKGTTENNTLRGLSPRGVDEVELEKVVKSHGLQIANMQDSLSQIVQLLKTMEDPPPPPPPPQGSRGRTREEKQKAIKVPGSSAQTEGGGPDAEDVDLSFRDEHLRMRLTYGKQNSPNVLQNPLSKEFFETTVPPNFSSLGLPTYSGTSDPANHLFAFMLKMQLINASDLCRAVPVTFSGQCRTWYTSLPEGIIKNFEQFVMLFSTKFASQQTRKLTVLAHKL
ncbi:unnamed protein product [Linum trigynum]|uniref:Retrotransposon gag domain-containing protein n=1 Tax=Linum trigynum TaxID=586398 RepID=A0AAV2CVL0_9ROSI